MITDYSVIDELRRGNTEYRVLRRTLEIGNWKLETAKCGKRWAVSGERKGEFGG
jgi:hypothetical protein